MNTEKTTRSERYNRKIPVFDQNLNYLVTSYRRPDRPDRSQRLVELMLQYKEKHHNTLWSGKILKTLCQKGDELGPIHCDTISRMLADGDLVPT